MHTRLVRVLAIAPFCALLASAQPPSLKSGKATHKRNGWITHTCFVYAQRDAKSKRIGYIAQGANVDVVDDESGWLEMPSWGANPVRNLKNDKFLDEAQMKGSVYFEASNFTQTRP